MNVAVAFDHRGVHLRDKVLETLRELGHEAVDLGVDTDAQRVDYPDKAQEIGDAVRSGEAERGILVCASGIGMCIAANKVPGVRAALCNDLFTARLSRQHNDANVLSMGGRIVAPGLADEILRVWLTTDFEGGRHVARLHQIAEIEEEG